MNRGESYLKSDKTSTKRQLYRNVLYSILERQWMLVSRLIIISMIAHALGPEGQAIYILSISTAALVTLPFVGLDVSNNYFTTRYPLNLKIMVVNGIAITLIGGCLQILCLIISLQIWADSVFASFPSTYIVWLPLFVLLLFIEIQLRGLVVGMNDYPGRMKSSCYGNIFLVIILGYFLINSCLNTQILLPIYATGSFFVCCILIGRIITSQNKYGKWALDIHLLMKTIKYSLSATLYRSANFLNSRIDVFVIARLLDTKSLGIYGLAVSLIEALTFISKSIPDAVVTYTASSKHKEMKEKNNTLTQLFRSISLFMILVTVMMLIFSLKIIPILFSVKFIETVLPLSIMLPGSYALAMNRVAAHHLLGEKKLRGLWIVNMAGASILLGLDLLLVPIYGILGAAFAFSISQILAGTGIVWMSSRHMKVRFSQMVVPKYSDFLALINLRNIYKTVIAEIR